MKNFLSLVLSFIIIIAVVPSIGLVFKEEMTKANKPELTETTSPDITSIKQKQKQGEKVKVYLSKEKRTEQVSLKFYIISVLAKEIDINAPDEALKAQAICIYTFLKRTSENSQKDYDISDNPNIHQAYLSKKTLKDFLGDSYNKNYKKLEKIVNSVYGKYMTYKGETILAAYHSSNSGKTESAENYWGEKYDYLTPVISIGDSLSPDYISYFRISPEQLKKKLLTLKDKSFTFPESPSDWIGKIEKTPSSGVKQIEIAGAILSGRNLRELLSLKSACFDIEYKDREFIFSVYGYGHAVGLSQAGAIYMAKSGFNYEQILKHYYNGVEIKQ